jgi:hypothetical protein
MRKATKSACVYKANVSCGNALGGVSWETDDNGFVVTARGKESTATYRYDREGYPLGKTTIAKGEQFTVASTPSSDPRKNGLHRSEHLQ